MFLHYLITLDILVELLVSKFIDGLQYNDRRVSQEGGYFFGGI